MSAPANINPAFAATVYDLKSDWPDPAPRFLRSELPPPPELPLDDVLSSRWAAWVRTAAEAKASPPDYVFAALVAVCASLVGNTRWPSPWQGWAEPPVIWAAAIGNPSTNKSPGLDAVLLPLKRAERALREKAKAELTAWTAQAEVAKLVEGAWKEAVKAAVRNGEELPPRPASANTGPEPFMPRLTVTDSTVEKLPVILAGQPRGTLLVRDELAGWLQGMSRYSAGSDRPFWLEAYGGRSYTVERMGREPVYVDRLTIGVLGGIQPDRLRSLLIKPDDDGLLARFLPVWPNPAPIKRPSVQHDEAFLDAALNRLLLLDMPTDEEGQKHPSIVSFTEDARDLLDTFRQQVREWETGAEGLLLSFIGKLSGLSVRLSLVLAMMDWASGDAEEPREITTGHFGAAAHLVESYLLPMARRAYAEASGAKNERAARRLVALVRDRGLTRFTTREVLRMECAGLSRSEELNPALALLEEADIIRAVDNLTPAQGGRPSRPYIVNPAIHRRQE